MNAELLTAVIMAATGGFIGGYIIKHIQDGKYLKDMEKFAEKELEEAYSKFKNDISDVRKAYKKSLEMSHQKNLELYDENMSLKKEIGRQKEFFEVPDLLGGTEEWL